MQTRGTSTLVSLGIHVAGAVLLLTLSTNPGAVLKSRRPDSHAVLLAPWQSTGKPAAQKSGGGGGGGDHSELRASRGALPKAASRQFVPPQAKRENEQPKLMMDETIVVAASAPLPKLAMMQIGDPLAPPGPPSNGRGSNGGIGEGTGGGVGPGDGPGYGQGRRGNTGGGDPSFGGTGGLRGAVTPAALIWKIEPEYSDEARRAKVQGTVLLYLEVDNEGKPCNIHVRQGLGLGLDEKAVEAVMRWKFRPGRQNGRAVATSAVVEVSFRLL
jgi:TonB family protein